MRRCRSCKRDDQMRVYRTVRETTQTTREVICGCGDRWETAEREVPGTRYKPAISSTPATHRQHTGKPIPLSSSSLDLILTSLPPRSDPDPDQTPARVIVRRFQTVSGTWDLHEDIDAKFREAFPAVHLPSEYAKIDAWLTTNPTNRKTPKGMPAFLNRWLGKAQDHARPNSRNAPVTRQEVQFAAGQRFMERGGAK